MRESPVGWLVKPLQRGVFFYPGGTGVVRDIVVIGPPFTITDADVDRIVSTLAAAVDVATAARAGR